MIAYSAVSSDLKIASKQKQVPVPSKIFGSLKTVRRGIEMPTMLSVTQRSRLDSLGFSRCSSFFLAMTAS